VIRRAILLPAIPAAMCAVASLKCGFLPVSQNVLRLLDRLSYHEHEGPSTELDECARLAKNFNKDVLFLRNQGVLVCGRTIASRCA